MGISTRLQESLLAVEEYEPLEANRGRAFQGPMPVGRGFVLALDEAENFRARTDAEYRAVVRPYLVGDDLTEHPAQAPRRFVIDFGLRALEEAARFPAALEVLRQRVKTERARNADRFRREHWWLLGRPVVAMREALAPLSRYIAGNAQGKRFLFTWQPPEVCPSNLTNVFAFQDDYAMGVLTSGAHQVWAHSEASSLELRPRYTPTSCFETFPWPQPEAALRDRIGALAADLLAQRQTITVREGIGLTAFYNALDEGAHRSIAELHRRLDDAVLQAYGFARALRDDPLALKAELAVLHHDVQAGRRAYEPFPRLSLPNA